LLFSQGVPMLLAGDELSHTQQGNNNAYCQDNEISWLNWDLPQDKRDFLDFVSRVIALRRKHPVFSRRRFLQGHAVGSEGLKDVAWLAPDGREMTEEDWSKEYTRCLGVYLAGAAIERIDRRGRPVKDDNFLVLLNAHHEPIPFVLPQSRPGSAWRTALDTAADGDVFEPRRYEPATEYPLQGRSLALLVETV
jgi:glycogen operon protein